MKVDFSKLSGTNGLIKKKQTLILGGIIGAVLIYSFWPSDRESKSDFVPQNEDMSIFRMDRSIDAEDRWLELSNDRLQALETRIVDLETTNSTLLAIKQELEDEISLLESDAKATIDAQADTIEILEAGNVNSADRLPALPQTTPLPQLPAQNVSPQQGGDGNYFRPVEQHGQYSPTPQNMPIGGVGGAGLGVTSFIKTYDLTGNSETGAKDPADYIPAGAYAPAMITIGANASVGVQGQSEPLPVVMRLTGRAMSAADESGVPLETNVTGCTITGSARGDLSSERVYVRLLTMSCARDGKISEVDVRGFVAGLGSAGVRGPVVMRDKGLVGNAFAGGLIEGFGDAASKAFEPQTNLLTGNNSDTNNLLSTQQKLDDSFARGTAKGVGAAGKLLAEYYIRRAEQYQPVVSLKAGTQVAVVFQKGAWLDGRSKSKTTNQETKK